MGMLMLSVPILYLTNLECIMLLIQGVFLIKLSGYPRILSFFFLSFGSLAACIITCMQRILSAHRKLNVLISCVLHQSR